MLRVFVAAVAGSAGGNEKGEEVAAFPSSALWAQFSSVQLLSHVRLFATPWTAACQASCPSPTPRAYSNLCPSSP